MTKILAWDVGIKHLAYCILEINDDTKKFTILKWENIDLTDVEQNACSCNLANGKKCSTIAKFLLTIDGKTTYYCGKHKKQYNVNITELEEKHVKEYDNKTKDQCQHKSEKVHVQRKLILHLIIYYVVKFIKMFY